VGKKKCKPTECPAGEKWAVPYADFLSLLLALFIALYALASVNTEKMKALKEEFVKIYDYSAKPEEATPVMSMAVKSGEAAKDKDKGNAGGSSAQLEEIARLAQMIEKMNIGEGSLEQKIDGAILKLPTKMLFPIRLLQRTRYFLGRTNAESQEIKENLLLFQHKIILLHA
jgi:chemotaxis protein MotB